MKILPVWYLRLAIEPSLADSAALARTLNAVAVESNGFLSSLTRTDWSAVAISSSSLRHNQLFLPRWDLSGMQSTCGLALQAGILPHLKKHSRQIFVARLVTVWLWRGVVFLSNEPAPSLIRAVYRGDAAILFLFRWCEKLGLSPHSGVLL